MPSTKLTPLASIALETVQGGNHERKREKERAKEDLDRCIRTNVYEKFQPPWQAEGGRRLSPEAQRAHDDCVATYRATQRRR